MKNLLPALLLVFLFTHCIDGSGSSCTTHATVRDLTGLDGCGFVFELEDGSRLEPVRPFIDCGIPPLSKEITDDPLYRFEFVDGKSVRISYEETSGASICMVGKIVKITCLEEIFSPAEQ